LVFSETVFLLMFFPAIIIFYHLSKNRIYKNTVLLLASLFFYAWGEPFFVFVMMFSVLINWLIGLKISSKQEKKQKKKWLVIGVTYDILLIVFFKYLTFITQNIGLLINKNITVEIALPIGISFFTFQIMSYIFDIYYGKAKLQKNYFDLLLYISMFPQLIAGPIVRYQTIADEINDRTELREEFVNGLGRFVIGLSKKILISNYVAVIADNAFGLFGEGEQISVLTAWLGAIAYTLQIYFDFSGYSDMAIGMGLMFGFHFEENFKYPYIAKSISDFWRRWHISLSTWFRDYVYIPMGGNRVSKGRWILNTFTVWLLTGIWHGANWTFIAWGMFYFVLLMAEKLLKYPEKMKWFSHIYTIFFVIIGWVLFRADSISAAIGYIKTMFGGAYTVVDKLSMYYLNSGKWVFIAGIILSLPIIPWIKKKVDSFALNTQSENLTIRKKASLLMTICDVSRAVFLLAAFLLCLFVSVESTYNPFIYFNF